MTLSGVNYSERMSALQNKQKTRNRILPFVTEYRPSVPLESQTDSNEQMAPNTKPALAKKNL